MSKPKYQMNFKTLNAKEHSPKQQFKHLRFDIPLKFGFCHLTFDTSGLAAE
jgi:hypothetical protein